VSCRCVCFQAMARTVAKHKRLLVFKQVCQKPTEVDELVFCNKPTFNGAANIALQMVNRVTSGRFNFVFFID